MAAAKNIRNMPAVTTNQIADNSYFNNKFKCEFIKPFPASRVSKDSVVKIT